MSRWPARKENPVVGARPAGSLAPAGPVLFLDRDGVVIEDRHYLSDPEQVVLVPGAADALVRAREAGYRLADSHREGGQACGDRAKSWRSSTFLSVVHGLGLGFFAKGLGIKKKACQVRSDDRILPGPLMFNWE